MTSELKHSTQPGHADRSPESDRDARDLVAFLKDRDMACPKCAYNLRNLTSPVCPECRAMLSLRLDEPPLNLILFALAIAPGMFCGVMLGMFTVLIILDGPPYGAGGVGAMIFLFLLSTLLAVGVILSGGTLIRQPRSTQATVAGIIWAVHLFGFMLFLMSWW